MKKTKRKPRKKVEKVELDYSLPMMNLGTDADPCFGKLHSLEAPECQECGDQQACQVMMAQRVSKKRIAMGEDKAFLDREEEDIIKLSILEIYLVGILSPDKVMSIPKVLEKVNNRFNTDKKLEDKKVIHFIKMAVTKSQKLKSFKNEDTGKRYLTLKKK